MRDRERSDDLNQAEPYGGPASRGLRPERAGAHRGPSVASAYLGGALMILSTLISGALGAPALLAFFIGLIVFAGTVMAMRPGAASNPFRALSDGPIIVNHAAAKAAGLDPQRAEARLGQADAELKRIEKIASLQKNPEVARVMRETSSAARKTLRALGEDPGDIDRARKFLVVVIPSALAAAEKFQGLGVKDSELEQRFAALMRDVGEAAKRQLSALRRDDELALEVEMDVLAERLVQN